ncbi:MAG: hypothetical protein IPQ09_21950 [Myxococcales bacterium]|nr:hypothetical protein [Myxococcales bacterium]
MRSDMFELLLERPRTYRGCRSRRAPPYPRAKLAPRPIEDSPRGEALGGAYAERALNENLSPLVRWIDRQVGRPWRLVYSELAEKLSPSSAVKKHVRDHVFDYVAVHVFTVEGVLYGHLRRGVGPLGRYRRGYFVCPKSDLLRRTPAPKRRSQDVRALAEGRYVVRRRGIWHYVETAKCGDDRAHLVCAYTGLRVSSQAYRGAVLADRVPWRWEHVATRAFVPRKAVLAALFREAERLEREAGALGR